MVPAGHATLGAIVGTGDGLRVATIAVTPLLSTTTFEKEFETESRRRSKHSNKPPLEQPAGA